ncbi:MAG: AbrB/MazE/SpoVT family DNA-binding domain-containing protein [Eubacteriales bacterium]|jgi:transcriptional pleiotropic regulator of transition state genes
MKTIGIVRKIDELGRVVLPKELRRTLDIQDRDELEIFVEGKSIILRKYEPSCIFCGSMENTMEYKDKIVCANCLAQLKQLNKI